MVGCTSCRCPHPPHLPFTYPPFAALVFAPLRLPPVSGPRSSGALINVAALFALVWLSLRAARPGLDVSGCSGGRWS